MIAILMYFFLKKNIRYTVKVFIVVGFFTFVGIDFQDDEYALTWFIRLTKLTLPFILYLFIVDLGKCKREWVDETFRIVIFLQVIVVVIAFMFQWDLFLTYNHKRFGYSGLIIAQNEASFFYVISFIFLFNRWEIHKDIKDLALLVLVMISSVLLGTKAVYIGVLSFPVFLFFYKGYYNWFRLTIGIVIGIGVLFGVYALGVFDFYINFSKEMELLTVITSLRDQLILERLPIVFDNWLWYNYLFGSVNPSISFVEMDIIDLFLYGGIIGSIFYYVVLFKTLFFFSNKNYLGWFLVSQFFLIGGLAGHVFASGINAIYLALTCFYLQRNDSGRIHGKVPIKSKMLPKQNRLKNSGVNKSFYREYKNPEV